jgi:hypothetical protein
MKRMKSSIPLDCEVIACMGQNEKQICRSTSATTLKKRFEAISDRSPEAKTLARRGVR